MYNYFSLEELYKKNKNAAYLTFPFYYGNKKADINLNCGITVLKSGSMRFRWNESNLKREKLLSEIAGSKKIACVELIHSKKVTIVKNEQDFLKVQSDGIITSESCFMPVVTVADCMPLYFADVENRTFGIVHSGWKGTGIIEEALKIAEKDFNCKKENLCVVTGPHIHDCCYVVNEERALYFKTNFTEDCVSLFTEADKNYEEIRNKWKNGSGKLYKLSLLKANLSVLKRSGIKEENIGICTDCTSCSTFLGSNRRETILATEKAALEGKTLTPEELSRCFTVMAAFVK